MSIRTDYTHLYTELEDGVLTLTLNRPEKLNAFTRQMQLDFIAALDAADADDAVRAIIVTGSGRGFCAGADLTREEGGKPFTAGDYMKEGADGLTDYSDTRLRDGGGRLSLRIFECLKPIISACNGAAVGVGVTMQLGMDVRLASTNARYGFVFPRRGIVPEACSSWFLPRLVGIQQALEWAMTGRVFDADEALKGGLVRSVHEPEDLLPAAKALAREIADNTAPVAVALSRQMMWKMLGADHPMEAHKIDSRGIASLGLSDDVAEGVASFLAKRPAEFRDKVSTDMPDYFPWWERREYR
ncbi:Enoyl-CoA hydratase [Albimonas donghaensis]|uniref:Enoyl-CoA hydratase n=1 Tax=Albimonas donghaensis TaxID=356660 RepID=A0A1H2VLX4_9RHOB|nr:crotonase/enoyl-CoA hydratase family protein [Albimonas donghaensis]SDW69277.1 Enoyl-CoA hydratase [Albimonas donghaensis]